jgi:hypothetical protein
LVSEQRHLLKVKELFHAILTLHELFYLTDFDNSQSMLLCEFSPKVDREKGQGFLRKLSGKIFLAAPSTQVFLFLTLAVRKQLFNSKKSNYSTSLNEAKSQLTALFTYDFFPIEIFVRAFEHARNRDFQEAVETGGKYGKNYETLVNELKAIFLGKEIRPKLELWNISGISFTINQDGEITELYPEDLSHGELKRLSIYMWLKHFAIDDAIILIDEIELAFHPDWQYQIISDLIEWAPNNQYILATHSYELCQALTPSHVKELTPKLLKNS